jgi:hypothetical protein
MFEGSEEFDENADGEDAKIDRDKKLKYAIQEEH